ncbi:MAG: hypothetical protein ACREU2_14510 [Steroidobacteraceae bacterium]
MSPPPAAPVALSQRDLGASTLAAIDNAREAIGLHDAVAAGNDLSQALGFAQQMSAHYSPHLPAQATNDSDRPPGDNGSGQPAALLSSYEVRVRLLSAQALLAEGDTAGTDAELSALQHRVPNRLIPRNLSLLRAAASLDLARDAASAGIPQVRTQLLCAQAALRAYDGPGHTKDAMALASTLGQALSNPTALSVLLPYQVSVWLGRVIEWTGSTRW